MKIYVNRSSRFRLKNNNAMTVNVDVLCCITRILLSSYDICIVDIISKTGKATLLLNSITRTVN
jgi:hypothetical protein